MSKRRTKILATVGPACSVSVLREMIKKGGLSAVRFNFSHGDFKEHGERLSMVKEAMEKEGKTVALLQDLSGPKIRTGELEDEFVTLKRGQNLVLTTDSIIGNGEIISVNYKNLPKDVKKGDRILLNDGKQCLIVEKIKDNKIYTKVKVGGKITHKRGVNLPDSTLSLSSFTKKDRQDLRFAIANNFDFVALSFVQTHKDVKALRKALKEAKSQIKIIAKIETKSAIDDLDKIIHYADGIMVARGDLAVEVGPEKVPMLQKKMVKKANNAGKIVIVATQMLESMIESPTPTRAEVSDVANAILDGADTVMLSAETAVGKYPSETVQTMSEIAKNTESFMIFSKRLSKPFASAMCSEINEVTARHAAKIAHELDSDAVVAFTETGTTAQAISKFRIKQPIFVISQNEKTLIQTNLIFGAFPLSLVKLHKDDDVISIARKVLIKNKIIKKGSKVVIVSGSIFGKPGETNTITSITI